MSGVAWVIAASLLVGAATVAGWPAGAALRRLDVGRLDGGDLDGGRLDGGRRNPRWVVTAVDLRRLGSRIQALADGPPRRAVGAAALTGAATGWIVAGPIAGLVLAAYGALGAREAVRRAGRRRVAAARSRSLDNLNALAADLRAGLAIGPLAAASTTAGSALGASATQRFSSGVAAGDGAVQSHELFDPRLAELTAAVWRLAEQTGAPAADLVERIEADARAADRARATAAAQAAGAQATALLLAALPIGGIALGYGIDVDPLQVLLHTPPGAACAIGAVLLQCGGLLWADRLSNGPTR